MFRITRMGLVAPIGLLVLMPCVTPAAKHHTAAYSHTLEDLRMAHALLQRTEKVSTADGSQDEVSLAIKTIDGAIAEISTEAPVNDKEAENLPRIDPRMKWSARLSMSFKWLDRAKQDCSKEKDSSSTAGLQTRVLQSIDQAHDRIQVAINTVNFDYSARNMQTRND